MDVSNVRLFQATDDYTTKYPQAVDFAKQQLDIFWHPDEIAVEKDIHDMRVNLSVAEKHGVITVLKLFTMYELIAGGEYWGERVMKDFPRPDIQRMASAFSFFELNVHAPFYNKINELLGLASEEFYTEYTRDETLKSRMEFIDEYVNHDDPLTSLGVFSMVEGAVLYSSFAFLKHFQNQGKNLMVNINAGINFSVRDENLHSMGGAWLYRKLKSEMKLDKRSINPLEKRIISAAYKIFDHEERIVDMIFEEGRIKGITELQMKNFVKSRINLCLQNLEIDPIFEVDYNPIAEWFYKNINGGKLNDFFYSLGSEYNRDWNESEFCWHCPEVEEFLESDEIKLIA